MTRGRISIPLSPARIYDFDKVEIGGYLFIKGGIQTAEQARMYLADYAARTGKKFRMRRMSDGLHAWRVEPDKKRAPAEKKRKPSTLEKTLLRSIERYEAQGDHKSAAVIRRRLAQLTTEASRTV